MSKNDKPINLKGYIKVNDSAIYKWQKQNEEASKRVNSYGDRISNGGWLSTNELNDYRSAIDNYLSSSEGLRWLNKTYGASYSEEDEKKWTDTVNGLNSNWDYVSKYYSQFSSENDMKEYQMGWSWDANPTAERVAARQQMYESNQARITEIESELAKGSGNWFADFIDGFFVTFDEAGFQQEGTHKETLEQELERLKSENERYEALQKLLDAHYAPVDETYLQKSATGWETYNADQFNAKANAPSAFEETVMKGFATSNENPAVSAFNSVVYDYRNDTSYMHPNDDWTEEQKQRFGYLYHENSAIAYQYAAEVNNRINQEKENTALQDISKMATSSGWAGVGNTLGAIVTAPFAMVDFLNDMAYVAAGREIPTADGIVTPFEYSQTVTGSIAQHLNEAGGTIDDDVFLLGGKGWGDVYSLGVSIAQSMMSRRLLGSTGTLVSYFGQGAASGIDDALSRGAEDWQAILYGISVGAFEGIAERYSIETLLNAKTTGHFFKDFFKTAGIQFLTEAQEEGLTSLLTNIADNVIMQDKSNFNLLVEQYMGQGMSKSEAQKKAWGEAFEGILYDTIAGGISGSVSGGAEAVGNHITFNHQTKKDGQKLIGKSGSIDALQALANEMHGVSNEVDKYSTKVTKEANAKNVGKLAYYMSDSITEQNRAEIEKALVEKGLSKKDAKRVSEYLATNNPTAEQNAEIEGNENIKAVVSELLADPKSAINERSTSLVAARLGIKYSGNLSNDIAKKNAVKSVVAEVNVKDKVSKDGKTVQKSTGEAVVIDKNNPIAKVEVKGEGRNAKRTVYLNTDKGKVDSADISYASESEALLYESFVDMSPAIANAVIKNYDGKMPVQNYINGMREGVVLYGMNNFQGIGKDISSKGYFASLSETDQAFALKLGKNFASSNANRAEGQIRKIFKDAEAQAKASEGTSTEAKKPFKKGKVSFDAIVDKAIKDGKISLNKEQKKAMSLAKHLASAMGINIVFYDATLPGTKYKKANGYFDENTDTIYLDLQNAESDDKTIANTLSHELVHFIKKWSPTKFYTFAKFLMEQYAAHGIDSEKLLAKYLADGYTAPEGFEEMVANACETMLLDSNAVVKLMELRKQDATLFEKIKMHILKILNSLRDMYKKYEGNLHEEAKALKSMTDVLEQMYSLFEEAAVQATENYQAVESIADLEANTDVIPVESAVKFSYKSLAKAAGFDATENDDGSRAFIRDGKAVSEVTVEDIENSPIGAFINYSLDKKDITKEQADAQKKMFADICTLSCKTNDFSMTMQFVGSEIFTAMKANADKQYGTTYDMPSICTKTQAVIDAMSARMVKLGRGLSTDEITAIYNEVNHAGNPVPCPECYVFSRWIGIGGLLNNIKQYQEYYGKMSVAEVAEAYNKLRAEVEAKAEELELSFGKAKGKLTKKYTDEYNKLKEKIEKADNQGEKVKETDRKKLKELESMMNTVKAMSWIENVYFADSAHTKINKNFRVPDDVLFDLNMGEKFATQYKAAWAFRTTQGAGYGKAITPYAEVSLGEGILVTNNTSNAIKGKQNGTLNNYFLSQNGKMDANARKALDRARLKQKIQAFLGGQRFQSTSDARYENASDYLLAALEMQAMHGMVQVYTKVDGAVPAFENWGFSTNQSLMPKGGGLNEDGTVKDTSVGGMNPKVAIANRNKCEHAGTITIGVNDNHIRALFALSHRDFIIPYHASGGKADVVAEFRRIQEGQEKKGEMVRSTDYSRTQSDKVLSDEVLKWLGKTDAEIEQIHKVREARIAILTRGKVDMEVVRGNRFLSALYDKFNGGVWDEVKIAKSKVESQIFPNEFWDESVTYEESGKITADYLEYCDDLGFLHRFSGLVPSNGMLVPVKGYDENGERVTLTDLAFKYENGKKTNVLEDFYWKVITDRRMYGHNGQYLPQKIVTLNDTTTDTVTTFAKHNDGRQYNKEVSLATAKKVSEGDLGIKMQVKRIVGESGKDYGVGVYLDSTLLSNLTDDERVDMVKEYLKELGGSVFTAYDNNQNAVDVHIAEASQKFKNKSGRRVPINKDMTNYLNSKVKQEAIVLIDELIIASTYRGTEPAIHPHDWLDNNGANDWDVWTTYLQDKENTVWEAKLRIANTTNGEKILYDIFPIEMVEQSRTMDTSTTDNRIAQNKPIVKGDFGKNDTVEQKISSAKTSIAQIPALFKHKDVVFGETNIDIGGGKFDLATNFLAEKGTKNYVFDPYNRSEEINSATLAFLQNGNKADTATCANVLNVIAEEGARANVILEVAKAIKEDGTAYFMVYEGDSSGIGRETSAGWQNNRKTADYVGEISEYFESVTRKGKLIIATNPVKNLPKATWEVAPGKGIKFQKKKDSQGNELSDEQAEFFKDSKVRDAKGNLLVVYHGTTANFNTFKKGDVGFHFGTKGAARGRVGFGKNVTLKEVYLNITNPIVFDEDLGSWDADYRLTRELYDKGILTKEDAESVLFTDDRQYKRTTEKANKKLASILLEKGYDGIVYSNTFETKKATTSYIAFNSNQAKLITNPNPTSNPDIRFQKKNLPNNADEIAKEHFGTTNKWSETGWLLKDGTQLDFSGRHWERDPDSEIDLGESYYSGRRNMEHYEIAEAFPEYSGITDMYHRGEILDDFLNRGNIRIVGKGCLDLTTMPTDEQFKKLVSYFRENIGRHIVIGIGKGGLEYKEGTSTSTIIEGIRDYFLKNRATQSDLMRFHNDDDGVFFQKKEVSNRTLLANALESTIDTSTQAGQNELKKLTEYKEKIALIEKEEARLAEIRAEIHDISFTKGSDRSKLSALNDEKIMTQNRIQTYDRQLTRLESMKPIKDVLQREKELVRKRTEEKGREALEAYKEEVTKVHKEQIGQERLAKRQAVAKVRESRDKQEAKQKLMREVLDTIRWLTHPAKTDVRCPDMLKVPYKEFLDSINLDSQRALNGGEATHNDLRVASAMQSLALVVEKVRAEQANGEGDASGFLDIPEDFVTVLRTMAEDIKKMMVGGDFVVNKMTSTEIKQITKLVRTLNHAIKEMNTLHSNLQFANAAALGDSSVTFLDSMGETKKSNSVKDFINWDNALPFYAFRKFGGAGESVFEELMDAQDKMAFLAQAILDFTSKTWTDKEAREWGEDTHTIKLSEDKSLTLTSADAMGIYCLSRRDNGQGLNHLLGGGVRVVGLTKGATKEQDSRATLTLEDVHTIINSLSKRQIEVAEAIQEFMSTTCAEWGNEISMKRFLTKDFTEKVYYPIESNNENLNTELPEASQSDLYRLLNISATKPLTQNANNQIVIRNIFDVFTNHASDMARLNAYGMALLDYMKWVNYREKTVKDNGQIETRGVRQSMNRAYGDKAIRYVLNLIKDINGRAGDVGSHPWLSKMTRMAKTASVAGNVRVMLLQITAYPRAAMVLPVDSLAKGLMKLPQIEKTKKYCGIALWKSFGFFDTNIARSIEDQIKGTKDIRAKLIELSLKGAEWADAITWGCLWNACEVEVAKTTKNKVGSEEFYYEVGKKLREVVYSTQVVDSVLTRSQLMRQKDGLTQMATAYMSEPTLTANILIDAGFQFQKAKRLGISTLGAWKHLGRTMGVYTSVAVFTTLIESLADAFRDDDEDEEFLEKFVDALLPNLISNVIPFNKLPIIADISDAVQSLITGDKYYTSEIMSSQWLTQTVYAINAWKSVLSGKNTPTMVYDALFKSIKAISFMTGLPISNVMRDLVALWNNIIGSINEDLVID